MKRVSSKNAYFKIYYTSIFEVGFDSTFLKIFCITRDFKITPLGVFPKGAYN